MKTKTVLVLLFASILNLVIPISVQAQTPAPLTLGLSRDFGYSSGTGKIEGTFSLKVDGPDDLVRVVFYIDEKVMGEATEPPFKLQFQTGAYPLGIHSLIARGFTGAGDELISNEKKVEFVSADEGSGAAISIVLPLLGVILLAALISYVIPTLFGKNKGKDLAPGTQRNYAPLGGTICPKCQRPFAMHIYGINLLVGKYDRCPYCGKWSLVHRFSMSELRDAEAAEIQEPNPSPMSIEAPITEEERLRKELDSSRFQDL